MEASGTKERAPTSTRPGRNTHQTRMGCKNPRWGRSARASRGSGAYGAQEGKRVARDAPGFSGVGRLHRPKRGARRHTCQVIRSPGAYFPRASRALAAPPGACSPPRTLRVRPRARPFGSGGCATYISSARGVNRPGSPGVRRLSRFPNQEGVRAPESGALSGGNTSRSRQYPRHAYCR